MRAAETLSTGQERKGPRGDRDASWRIAYGSSFPGESDSSPRFQRLRDSQILDLESLGASIRMVRVFCHLGVFSSLAYETEAPDYCWLRLVRE
jgi:L-rhamnose isomerase